MHEFYIEKKFGAEDIGRRIYTVGELYNHKGRFFIPIGNQKTARVRYDDKKVLGKSIGEKVCVFGILRAELRKNKTLGEYVIDADSVEVL